MARPASGLSSAGKAFTIGIVAGEVSGDRLGAGLMQALAARLDQPRFIGVGGEAMRAAGLIPMAGIEQLGVNAFKEPLIKLPGLLRLLLRLRRRFLAQPPDLFIGVDFNEFNLLLEGMLKRVGVPTIHYVSPSVYAWRRRRIKRVARSVDLLLALYPFEPALYSTVDVAVTFVGHPLADAIPLDGGSAANQAAARSALGLTPLGSGRETLIALLPGSRAGEVERHIEVLLDAAAIIDQQLKGATFLVPCPQRALAVQVERALGVRWKNLRIRILPGSARQALTACDGTIIKAGTGTLEAMLLRRPMVVTYRLGALSYLLVRLLVHSEFVALPNVLAGRELVAERLQRQATPEKLAAALLQALDKTPAQEETLQAFSDLHRQLQKGADERAAEAAMTLIECGGSQP